MSNLLVSDSSVRPVQPIPVFAPWLVLAAWLAFVAALGARGSFLAPPGEPPLPLLLGFAVPLVAFFVALRFWSSFRALLLAADLRLLTAIQGWRFLGLAFIALQVHGILPAGFAWPAGLGDMAIAAAAPWMLMGLLRRPGFAAGKAFLWWNRLGILDLLVAVGSGALASGVVPAMTGEVTTEAVASLPLVLVPAYLVPIMLMLHVTALLQVRAAAR
jgi:hypothetical protein